MSHDEPLHSSTKKQTAKRAKIRNRKYDGEKTNKGAKAWKAKRGTQQHNNNNHNNINFLVRPKRIKPRHHSNKQFHFSLIC